MSIQLRSKVRRKNHDVVGEVIQIKERSEGNKVLVSWSKYKDGTEVKGFFSNWHKVSNLELIP